MAGVEGAAMSAVSNEESCPSSAALRSTLDRFFCAGVVTAATVFASTTLGLSLSQQGKELQDSGVSELVLADYPLKRALAPTSMVEDYWRWNYEPQAVDV